MGGAGPKQPSDLTSVLCCCSFLRVQLNASGEDTDRDLLFLFLSNSGSSDNCPAWEERFLELWGKYKKIGCFSFGKGKEGLWEAEEKEEAW